MKKIEDIRAMIDMFKRLDEITNAYPLVSKQYSSMAEILEWAFDLRVDTFEKDFEQIELKRSNKINTALNISLYEKLDTARVTILDLLNCIPKESRPYKDAVKRLEEIVP